jgi:hypothetical protein
MEEPGCKSNSVTAGEDGAGRFKKHSTAVSHHRIGLNIFANLLEFDPVVVVVLVPVNG